MAKIALTAPVLTIRPLPPPPSPPELCALCGTVPVRRAGLTCRACARAVQGERQAAVLALRARGLTWAEVAARSGLSGPGAAHNIAYRGAPPVPVPASQPDPAVERRLWWTTVRPWYGQRAR